MLFVSGTRDALADLPLLTAKVTKLGSKATVSAIEGADHGFHVPNRLGRTDADAFQEILDDIVAWIAKR